MTGSVQDAEDALQEALLRAWRAYGRFEGRAAVRTWLYRIATNACLDLIGRRKRVLPMDFGPASDPHEGPGAPLAESVWVEPFPDAGVPEGLAAPGARYERRESVELAFIAALQHLPARQRAVLILREVLGFSAAEVAETLETTVASVNSAMQRARKAIDDKLPSRSQQATLRQLGDDALTAIVERYVDAWERGEVEEIVALLTEDALVTMPPMPTWYRGREAAAVFLREFAFARRWSGAAFVAEARAVRLLRTRASGQVALAAYGRVPGQPGFRPYALQVLAFEGERIAQVDGFVGPGAVTALGLPDVLPD
jgi:RNA polymerase sigma-70 factor (ECF subfamily)